MGVWAERKRNHSVGIREIPKTQLGWLGQTQLVHTTRQIARQSDRQAGKQNTALARGIIQVI